jgi:Ca2+-binding RTX toxin-like protein
MAQLYARSGDETVVNTVTQSTQQLPVITRLASGGYVVVWTDLSQIGSDTSNSSVKGQIYDSGGQKVGGELPINITSTSGPQRVESAAALPGGGFVVVFETSNELIRAQRFDSAGAPVGAELPVTALNPNYLNSDASVTVLTNGVMIVTWSRMDFAPGPNYGQHIFAKAFSAATGAALSGEFRLDSSGTSGAHQSDSSVTALASGGWVATWVNDVAGEIDIVGQVFAANGSKVGGEFAVNTATAGQQSTPVITALTGGGFAVAWTDGLFVHPAGNTLNTGPTPDTSVKVQLFTDLGVKVGGEIAVNGANDGHQGMPGIDDLPNGGFVVTWSDRSLSRADQDGYAVMARLFDSSGAAAGNPFLVNSVTAGDQETPAVTGLASGGFAVAWKSAGVDGDIKAQLFAPSTSGPSDIALSQASVSETAIANQAVATLSDNGGLNGGSSYTLLADSTGGGFRIDGDKLVVAANSRLDFESAPNASVTVRVTDLNGNSYDEVLSISIADVAQEHRYAAGAEFDAASSLKGDQREAAVGALASGGYVMTWVDSGGNGGDGSGATVKAQLFDSSGARVGGEFQVNTATANAQKDPSVTGLAGGGFVVFWEDSSLSGGDASEASIKGQRFDSAGAKAGGEFLVNTLTAASQIQPASTALASGGFVVTWTDKSTADQFGNGDIRAQIYDPAGVPVGTEILVNSTVQGPQGRSAVAATATGGFVVTWYGGGINLFAQRFDGAGNKLGSEIAVAGPVGLWILADPAVAVLASGEFVISWSTGLVLQAQLFAADGTKIGAPITVDSHNSGAQIAPTISALPWGGFIVSWEDWSQQSGDAAAKAVRAQIFDASGARVGDEFVVNAGTQGDQSAPVSSVLKSGGFVVGWTEGYFDGTTPRTAIEGRVFSQVGPSEGDDFVLGTAGVDILDGLGGDDQLHGLDGDDTLTGGHGDDLLDGGAGADAMTGGTGNDIYVVDSAGDTVTENAAEGTDEIRTSLASFSLVGLDGVENLTGTSSSGQILRGNAGNNALTGGAGGDVLRLYDGGDDIVLAGGGNDSIFFIGALTGADIVNGGDGGDTLVLQGPYGSLTLTANVTQIENISILGGFNTAFGEPGTNRYDYVLTTNDANFAAGVQARVNAAALLEGEDFTFDGSAETDGSFVVYGGKGKDTLLGGLGNDIFFFAEERFASGDTVNGNSGYDGMFLRGNYTIDFNAPGFTGLFTNIDNLTLTSAADQRYARGGGSEFDYNLTLSDAIVGAGGQLTVSGALLMATETMILDASAETDGILRLFGGKASDTLKGGAMNDLLHGNLGADTLAGGGGADAFRFQNVTESNSASMDQILDFTPGTDKIELDRIDADTLTAGNQAFSWIGSDAFTGSAGQLRAYEQGGTWFVEGDTNGDGAADLVIALTLQGPTPLSASDFLL